MRGATRYDLNSLAAEPRRFTRERSGFHHFELSAGQILKGQRPKHARRGKSRLVTLPQNRLSPFLSGPAVSPDAPADLAVDEADFSGGQEGGAYRHPQCPRPVTLAPNRAPHDTAVACRDALARNLALAPIVRHRPVLIGMGIWDGHKCKRPIYMLVIIRIYKLYGRKGATERFRQEGLEFIPLYTTEDFD
jgi:hypothetical protein